MCIRDRYRSLGTTVRLLAVAGLLLSAGCSADAGSRTSDDVPDRAIAARFGALPVQSLDGRIEPLGSYASEVLRKLLSLIHIFQTDHAMKESVKKIVVFTGAGVSADSGLSTFRDADGLWDKYRIEDVCTPEALARNREKVVEFYNIRRRELLGCSPNAGHEAIRRLEDHFDVDVITQNIDDLHERAGSSRVLHLHGELRKLRSSIDESLIVPIDGWEQKPDQRAPDG